MVVRTQWVSTWQCLEHCLAHRKGTINGSKYDGDDDDDDMFIILSLHPKLSLKTLKQKIRSRIFLLGLGHVPIGVYYLA